MSNLDNYIELDDMVSQIDEAMIDKKKKKHYTEEELEEMQEFADEIDFTVE